MDKRFKLGDEAQTLVECGGEIGVEYEVKWWGWVSRSLLPLAANASLKGPEEAFVRSHARRGSLHLT